VDATVFRKIRPTLERARPGLAARFSVCGRLRARQLASYVVVMQHTVSDVIHNHCGHAAML